MKNKTQGQSTMDNPEKLINSECKDT